MLRTKTCLLAVLYLFGLTVLYLWLTPVWTSSNSLILRGFQSWAFQKLKSRNCSSEKAFNVDSLDQLDPRLHSIIRDLFLINPPPAGTPYKLTKPDLVEPSMGQSQAIRSILLEKTGGFFVECGALDGELVSNTLYMERKLGWQGLLIEADPKNVALTKERQRQAWLAPVCLSLETHPTMVRFKQSYDLGRIQASGAPKAANEIEIQCFPFAAIVLALNRTRVDYFSLDIEGDELKVLKTIPFHAVDVRTLSVEFIHNGNEGKQAILDFMTSKGYVLHSEVKNKDNWANDFIFVKKT